MKYIVLVNRRGVGWVADGQPSTFKAARAVRDVQRSKYGRGKAIMVQMVDDS